MAEAAGKVLSAEFVPIADVFDHSEDAMTTRDRLKKWYDDQASRFRAEGMEEGKGVGIKEGIKKGRAEGQRGLLAKQLRLKFGTLDDATEARLAGASSAQLGKWAERVLTARSLEEIWT